MAWFLYVRDRHQWHTSWEIHHERFLHHFYRNWKYRYGIRAGKVRLWALCVLHSKSHTITSFRGWNRKTNLLFGRLVSSLMWLEFAISFNETLTICLNCAMERRIRNPVKHLRWRFLQKYFNRFHPLTILAETSTLVVWLDYQCTSVTENKSCIR